MSKYGHLPADILALPVTHRALLFAGWKAEVLYSQSRKEQAADK